MADTSPSCWGASLSQSEVEVTTRAQATSTSRAIRSASPVEDPSHTPRQRSRTEFDNRPYAEAENWTLSHDCVAPKLVPRLDSIMTSTRSSSLATAVSHVSDQQYHEGSAGHGAGDSAEGSYALLVTGMLGLAVVGSTVVEAQGHDVQTTIPIGLPPHGRSPILMDEPFDHAGFGSGDSGFLSTENADESMRRGRGRTSRSTSIIGRFSRSASPDWSSPSSLREVPSSTNVSSWTPDRSPSSTLFHNVPLFGKSPARSTHTTSSRRPSTSDAITSRWRQQNLLAHVENSSEKLSTSLLPSSKETKDDQATVTSVKQLVLQTRRSSIPAVREFTVADEKRSSVRSIDRARDGLGLNLELFDIAQDSPAHLSTASPVPTVNVARLRTPSVDQSDQFDPECSFSILADGLDPSPRSAASTSSNTESVSPSFLITDDSPVLSTSTYSSARPVRYNTSPSAESPQSFLARTTESPMLPPSSSNQRTSSAPQVDTWAGGVPMPTPRENHALPTPDTSLSVPEALAPLEKRATTSPPLAVRTTPGVDQTSQRGTGRSRQTSSGSDTPGSKISRRLSSFFSKLTPSTSPASLSRPTTPTLNRSPIEDGGSKRNRAGSHSKSPSPATLGPPASIHQNSQSSTPSSTLKKGTIRGSISMPSPAITDPASAASSESNKVLNSSPLPSRTLRSIMGAQDYNDAIARHGMLEMKRQEVIFELCETERSFVEALKGVMEVFALPLRDRQGGWIRGVPIVVARLFDWAADMVYLHAQIAEALLYARGRKPQDIVTRIATVFMPFVPQLEIHQPYLVRFESVTRLIERMAADQNSDFGAFVRMQTRSFLGGMTLSSFLLKPVQRLMKYPLFFKQLCELTPKDHVDYRATISLLRDTDLIIRVMQEVKSREDEYEELKRIEAKMRGLPQGFRLAQRDRRLLAQGSMKRIHASEKGRSALLVAEASGVRRRSSIPAIPEKALIASSLPVKLPLLVESRRSLSGTSDSGSDDPSILTEHDQTSWPAQCATLDTKASYPKASSLLPKTLPGLPNEGPGVFSSSPVSMWLGEGVTGGDSPNVFALSLPKRPGSSMSLDSISGRRTKPLKLRAKESYVQVFIFSDLVVFAQRMTENGSKMSSKGASLGPDRPGTAYEIIESIGVSKVDSVMDLSGQTEHDHLLAVALTPLASEPVTVFLTVPPQTTSGSSGSSNLPSSTKIHARWNNAFERSRIKSAKLSNILPGPLRTLDIPVTTDERTLAASFLKSPGEGYTAPIEPLDERVDLTSERAECDWWRLRFNKMRSELETESSHYLAR
ncbi:hypothetical protein MVLG_00569 [Microbotryum lychnidis-dioicae p1A1 Lamole]|uniref:DH domain-containing protein n=1 Tax=Microbotryum lychnidis-dioicae (strain p1A1 Lamole / MvSl-1064) TaxID=683840 RepID=U5GZG7_USTV1|nr:hypothetical protein MVLG_00569 [Microbotryum lychnidis-dioicae p1A1 Lamole]|eukprot:KDE09249.1 hypothetical protein MVLG_00569 [Microbotryum lychnidis-dioicae p1A1 Lamole]